MYQIEADAFRSEIDLTLSIDFILLSFNLTRFKVKKWAINGLFIVYFRLFKQTL